MDDQSPCMDNNHLCVVGLGALGLLLFFSGILFAILGAKAQEQCAPCVEMNANRFSYGVGYLQMAADVPHSLLSNLGCIFETLC